MAYGIRVSLPGYNALTDPNPDHFALKSDLNDILIKEYTRGTITVPDSTEIIINHNLGYFPFFITFYQIINQPNIKNYSYGSMVGFDDNGIVVYSNINQLIFWSAWYDVIFNYYIFYDNIT